MTDLELTKLCAEAMGITLCKECWAERKRVVPEHQLTVGHDYDPLRNDAQAMALVKRFGLFLGKFSEGYWCVDPPDIKEQVCTARNNDLNRAIVECCAHMMIEKTK